MRISPLRSVFRFLFGVCPLAITACNGSPSNPDFAEAGCVAQPVANGSCDPGEQACPASAECQPQWSCDGMTHKWTEAIPNCVGKPGIPRDAGLEPDTGTSADAAFPCGPQPGLTCAAQQYCLVGCTNEGPILCSALLDSGVCSNGSSVSNACSSSTPCKSATGGSFPTTCFDDLDASPCGRPDPATALEGRTIYCACTL